VKQEIIKNQHEFMSKIGKLASKDEITTLIDLCENEDKSLHFVDKPITHTLYSALTSQGSLRDNPLYANYRSRSTYMRNQFEKLEPKNGLLIVGNSHVKHF